MCVCVCVCVDSTKEVAKQYLPADNEREADWFKENEHIIKPALEERSNLLRALWLSSKADVDRVNYVEQKGAVTVQKLIRYVKNKWFKAKAAEIELKMSRSRSAWKSIKQLLQARWGLRPTVTKREKDTHIN